MIALPLLLALTTVAVGAYPPRMEGCSAETYKTVGEVKLDLYLFRPAQPAATPCPAIVFFFGGGWQGGSPQQFEPQCRYLAGRGLVAITADYRVASRHHVKAAQCVADARSAVRWLRANAARLGLDPQRLAAGGGSAGGHLAACTPWIDAFDEPGEDRKLSAAPNALVLCNPVVLLAPLDGLEPAGFAKPSSAARFGAQPEQVSPIHHLAAGGPPTLICHGRADTTVPFATAELFAAKMKAAGNRCELRGYDDQPHGFFNREPYLGRTLAEMDAFLTSLGWLPAPQVAP